MTDRFEISLTFRHPSLDPSEVSGTFGLTPTFAFRSGSHVGPVIHKSGVWHGVLAKGAGSEEYEEALKKSVSLLESRQEWLNGAFRSEGEFEVIFAYWTDLDEGKICQTDFYPELLVRLSKLNAGMRVEVWKDEEEMRASD